MYSTERKSNAATADSSNNDEEINEDNNENAFKSSIMTPVAVSSIQFLSVEFFFLQRNKSQPCIQFLLLLFLSFLLHAH